MAELERVAKLALLTQEKLWSVETELTWAINLDENACTESRLYADGEKISSSPLDETLGAIMEFFKPQPDEDKVQRHLYLRLSYPNGIAVEAESPSAHERLEAALDWRDWLATYSPHTIKARD